MTHTEIEEYLLGEMTKEERNELEERILADDAFFFDVCETENALVDRYITDSLMKAEAVRFERALERTPALAEKVANARALNRYISTERAGEDAAAAAVPSMWERIAGMFTFASPVPAMAMGGLVLLLAVGLGLLVLENGRRTGEIARLEAELSNSSRSTTREAELERELANSQTRESQMQQQIDGEKDITGDLTADLARERENRRKLEAEIEAIKKESTTPINRPTPGDIEPPTILAVRLGPAGARGGGGEHEVKFEGGAKRVSIVLALPTSVGTSERLAVRVNGREVARNLSVSEGARGSRTLAINVTRSQLQPGENVFAVVDESGVVLSEYRLKVGTEDR